MIGMGRGARRARISSPHDVAGVARVYGCLWRVRLLLKHCFLRQRRTGGILC